ncbi:hypothetical protein AVEN_266423-1 [Araneus ventricosus]|uniref:Uncharacterized protein n=1 Tax=Araneus ventricosus TaxID=182803 RepID=A0A4Y2JX51_ARAVE|nr:hypothetical protein AVEN_266423-1 [Araneus ventricosus]
MAYLARSKKENLKVLAEELGLTVKKEFQVKQLHSLITVSYSYGEEFMHELLVAIKEEREKEREHKKKKREREAQGEHEQEQDRAFELQKLELEAKAARAQPIETMQIPDQSVKIRMHDGMPRFNPKEDDISLFLVLFERQAKIMNIPAENQVAQLISLLPHDIVQLITREPEEDVKKYEYVKAAKKI